MIVTHEVSQRITVLIAADRIDLLGYVGHWENGYLNRHRMCRLSRPPIVVRTLILNRGGHVSGDASERSCKKISTTAGIFIVHRGD